MWGTVLESAFLVLKRNSLFFSHSLTSVLPIPAVIVGFILDS